MSYKSITTGFQLVNGGAIPSIRFYLYTDAMSIKLVLLKSNEEVIADVKELVDENDKPIFVVLENPYCCKLIEDPVLLTEGAEDTETKYSVQYYPFMPLSDEKKISIDPSWVVAIVEPKAMVKESYEARMNGTGN